MPWHKDNIKTLCNRMKGDLASSLGLAEVPRRSVVEVLGKVFAGAVHGLYDYGAYIAKQVMPYSADKEHLERHASWWGIGRKKSSFAKGKVTFTGTEGVVFPSGIRITAGDVQLISCSAGTIENGQVTIEAKAEKAGIASNLATGTKLSLLSPVAGVLHEGEVIEALSGGTEIEDDESLLQRLIFRIQNPPAGGNAKDYELWALSQNIHGIAVIKAWVSPLEMGLGTVSIRFITETGIPTEHELQQVKDYIERVRPVTAHVFVVAPIARPLNFEIRGLAPATYQVRQEVEKEIRDLIRREAKPNGTLLISHIREAISIAIGETDHELISPIANVTHGKGELCTFGGITWL